MSNPASQEIKSSGLPSQQPAKKIHEQLEFRQLHFKDSRDASSLRILILLFLLISIISASSIPYVRYCRHVDSAKCVVVDLWFGQYETKRLFPMKCVYGSCPIGTVCDPKEECWNEVKMNENNYKEMKMVDGKWRII
ncbi:hypothetical protein L5515_004647 [Caenorhabditis briggsae]|uniref:Uncharacterized protein n=1 Tax=Caenorhabditis briggsae TaxID=6238 RepID=A0AAE9JBD2_CAEBR|nr:hypothetical protein L5515_004647 [Caenorhabditis briggsae]